MEKINVAELLKDCPPKGIELDCVLSDSVELDGVDMDCEYPIRILIGGKCVQYLTAEGYLSSAAYGTKGTKCVIFPKGKTTWEGFHRPLKDGDVIFTHVGKYTWISIFKQFSGNSCCTHIDLCINDNDLIFSAPNRLCDIEEIKIQRLATEEEKEKLFNTIKANGYKWNDNAKTLEKLASKFDINTLVPFESRVLVRNDKDSYWRPSIFGCYIKDVTMPYYVLGGTCWKHCIPYEGNTHFRGKTDDCDECFKNWK